MYTAKEIRQQFLDFFASKGHTIVPSAPMVIKNDPTLMFTNAGMNQFKDIFLGNTTPKMKRATDSQKCLRVSGKHNDLEAVGHDGRHHTMFEMLGNWSFGDYFKAEAISWAWELLTDVYKIDKSKLYATVFEGSAEDGTTLDEEARQAWMKLMPADHIIFGNKHDNFWEMGDTGPCGPCSEIHIDLRSDEEIARIPGKDLVNTDNDQVIEIWNLVFMQYNRKADGSLEPLPAKNIDTGMGFERLCMVLQGKTSNYDTDVFSGMIGKIEELSGHKYHENGKTEVAMRVIADHIRAIAFSIADGQLPSNVKAGYVIRRILRRAVRYGYTFLGFDEPFLCALIPQLVSDMGEAYPELGRQQKLIESVIREEEMSFLRTLDRGIRLMDDYVAKNASTKTIPGEDAFVLYDTYGFPIDLTELIASEKGYTVDMEGFAKELQKQKDRARNATANEFGDWVVFHEGEEEAFLGYDNLELEGVKLLKQRTVKQKNKTMFQLVFDRTPFYAEMGGQVGDTGVIVSESGEQIRILNTVKENNLTIHIAERIPADSTQTFTLKVDASRRLRITANHTATHLLDYALRETLGTHIEQKGSFVGPDYFRFDFSHFAKVTDEELRKVEHRVNELIRADYPLQEKRDATMEEANAMGAIALFGEKYGDTVRVVDMGQGFSVEFCGGTHLDNTAKAGPFRIKSESSVASGVRRIEATCGKLSLKAMESSQGVLSRAAQFLKTAPSGLLERMEQQANEMKQLRQALEKFKAEASLGEARQFLASAKTVKDLHVLATTRNGVDTAELRTMGDFLRDKDPKAVAVIASINGEKITFLAVCGKEAVARGIKAGDLVRHVSAICGGKGGGKPDSAMGGGSDPLKVDDALASVDDFVSEKLG